MFALSPPLIVRHFEMTIGSVWDHAEASDHGQIGHKVRLNLTKSAVLKLNSLLLVKERVSDAV